MKFYWKVGGYVTLCMVIYIIWKYMASSTNKTCSITDKNNSAERSQIYPTAITAYYDIGSFAKGSSYNIRSPQHYRDWMNAFTHINNNVVFYSDSKSYIKDFRILRKGKEHMTKIIYLPRRKLRSFDLKAEIQNILLTPNYPKFFPNTVMPEYILVQHTKYVVVKHAIDNRIFDADFYCWLDIGIYRDIAKENKHFHLEVPVNLNISKVAFNEIFPDIHRNLSASDIFLQNRVRVAGNAFVGSRKVLKRFCDQYMNTVSYFISQNLVNTDQQVLFAMYKDANLSKSLSVEIQTYRPNCTVAFFPDAWFYLGYYMLHYD